MKKTNYLALLLFGVLFGMGCKEKSSPTLDIPPTFTFVVEEDNSFTNLPALQSFAFGIAGDGTWLMFGGRTNGFHGFDSTGGEGFPFKMANQFMYAYNPTGHTLDSMSIDSLPAALQMPYASTNMECRQVDSLLYVCGGYGVSAPSGSVWTTHNTFSRISIQGMVNAIRQKSRSALAAAIAYDTSSFVRATGGELFYMQDGKFYLTVGHDYEGSYNGSTPVTQTYLDAVHVFTVQNGGANGITVVPGTKITDGLADSVTQFRRRDLVVAPNVNTNGSQDNFGISIYAGVFTLQTTQPFRFPIYVTPGTGSGYRIDTTYRQYSNVYSAPNLQMFDSVTNEMYTTIFGGLGDTLASNVADTAHGNNPDSAAFTKFIMTLKIASNGTTSHTYNPTMLPAYVGAEGVFIRANNVPLYHNNGLGIIDFRKATDGTIGHIYGGIHSSATEWSTDSTTRASSKVYKVSIIKVN